MTRTFDLFERISQNRILSHVIFWVLAVISSTLVLGQAYEDYEAALMQNIILLPPKILAAYVLIYFQIYRLLFKRKYILFFLTSVIAGYLFSVFGRVLMVHVFEPLYRHGDFTQESLFEIMTDLNKILTRYLLYIYMYPMLLVILKLIKEHFITRQNQETLKKEKVVAELKFLKAQIHPHFLFNTLNNLYVLTLQKSDKAPELLIKLSDMLDYMLYQCNVPVISIEKEMELIQNYLDLEMLRYGDRLKLKFDQNIDNPQSRIAPLILLPLIENAFKHGASGAINEPEIQISLGVSDQQLTLTIFNTKPQLPQMIESAPKEGIGMANVQKQLNLTYPKAYEMEVLETTEAYSLTLQIDLKQHQR